MASVQQAQDSDVAQIDDNEKSVLGELAKEAQALLEKNRDASELLQLATVAGGFKNSQGRLLKLEKIHDGFGQFVVKPSEYIGKNGGSFVHRAVSVPIIVRGAPAPVITDSKAAVIYGTFDYALPRLGYLLAWYKAQKSTEHKVYVQAGDVSKLMKLEWTEIEQKLDESGSESKYVDKETGAAAAAEIINLGGNLASLGANFDHYILPH